MGRKGERATAPPTLAACAGVKRPLLVSAIRSGVVLGLLGIATKNPAVFDQVEHVVSAADLEEWMLSLLPPRLGVSPPPAARFASGVRLRLSLSTAKQPSERGRYELSSVVRTDSEVDTSRDARMSRIATARLTAQTPRDRYCSSLSPAAWRVSPLSPSAWRAPRNVR